MEDALIVIPARIGSTRLPRKPLITLNGVPLIVRTVRAVKAFSRNILVATDSLEVVEVLKEEGVKSALTPSELPSGTDRVYEASKELPFKFVINVQGDEPFVKKEHVEPVYRALKAGEEFATVATPFKALEEVENPNRVKVVLDKSSYAIYFSRSPIPYFRSEKPKPSSFLKHIGIYGFTKESLKTFVSWPKGKLEEIEKLEQLRIIENGRKIFVSVVSKEPLGIDTEEDLKRAEKILREVE
ncbi:3-deoxy-manno-octulosonate cytidylyltransferase [Thermovibrio sp.]